MIMGEADVAADYRQIRQSGKKLQNERLWNGEYYIQKVGAETDSGLFGRVSH